MIKSLVKSHGLHGFIESRIKTVAGFEEKCNRPGKSYSNPAEEITDLCGIRIVVSSLSEVEIVEKFLREEFTVDEKRSENKRTTLKVDEFGYLSSHVIVKAHKRRKGLAEWSDVADLWSEVQVRTVLEHAWAVASHELAYKSEVEIPSALRRKLVLFSGMLEHLDGQLNQLVLAARALREEYKRSISEDKLDIEINADSLAEFFAESPLIRDLVESAVTANVKLEMSYDLRLLMKTVNILGVGSINELNALLQDALPWACSYLKAYRVSMTPGTRDNPENANFFIRLPNAVALILIAINAENLHVADLVLLGFRKDAAMAALDAALEENPKLQGKQ